MRPVANGVRALETAQGEPYVLWACDEWKCPKCEATVLVGFPTKGMERHDSDFKDALKRAQNTASFYTEFD
jgi:hypothetical protein